MFGSEGISYLRKSRCRVICGRVLSQKTRKQRTSQAVLDKTLHLIRRAIYSVRNFDANMSWMGRFKGNDNVREV